MSLEDKATRGANPELSGGPLTFSIDVEKYNCDRFHRYSIVVGNSGLEFVHFTNESNILWMHFTPEHFLGTHPTDDLTQRKYTTIYCAAFYEFLLFWSNTNFFEQKPNPTIIEGYTNLRMHLFRQNLFNRSEEIYETPSRIGNSCDYRMDLEKLTQHPDLINRLKRFHDRAKTANFRMKD